MCIQNMKIWTRYTFIPFGNFYSYATQYNTVKKSENLNRIKEDIKKLEDLMLKEYRYEDAVFIGFNIENFDRIFELSEKVNFILISKDGEVKIRNRVGRFKDSPLGRIPEEWDIFILGDVCTDIQDGTHYSPQTSDDGNFMYITSKNIKFGHLDLSYVGYISKKEHEKIYNRCRVKHGDILLTKDGVNTGNAAINIIKEPFSLLSSVAYLRPNKKIILREFLLQFILSYQGQKIIKDSMKGLAITRITLEIIKYIPVKVPPLPEQHRIASILSQIDEAIEKEQKYKEKLERIKRGLMEDLLTGKVRVLGVMNYELGVKS